MERRLATMALVVSAVAASASAQPQGPQFNDCWTPTRSPAFGITATADGVPLRFDRNPDGLYPMRAIRMRVTGDVLVRCFAVTDRPIHCLVDSTPSRRVDLAVPALRALDLARLATPAGVWPLRIDVRFRQSDPGDPTLIACGSRQPTSPSALHRTP